MKIAGRDITANKTITRVKYMSFYATVSVAVQYCCTRLAEAKIKP